MADGRQVLENPYTEYEYGGHVEVHAGWSPQKARKAASKALEIKPVSSTMPLKLFS